MKVAFKVHNSRGGKEMFKDKKTLRVAYRGKKKNLKWIYIREWNFFRGAQGICSMIYYPSQN
jgi:hypothetical protein